MLNITNSKAKGHITTTWRTNTVLTRESVAAIQFLITKLKSFRFVYERDCFLYNHLVNLSVKITTSKSRRLQSDLESISETVELVIFSRWRKRSCRNMSYLGQCRRKCSLSSFAFPQSQIGLNQICAEIDVHSNH